MKKNVDSKKKNISLKQVLISFFGAAFLIFIFVFPNNPSHGLLLRYLSLFSSWPLGALIIGLAVLFIFRAPIETRLLRSKIDTKYGTIHAPDQTELKEINENEVEPEHLATLASKVPGDKLIDAKTAFEVINYVRHFEWSIRFMFQSQFHLLVNLIDKKRMQKGELESFYFEYLGRGGTKEYSFDSYVDWLVDKTRYLHPVPEPVSNYYELTDLGKTFLVYCHVYKYSDQSLTAL